MSDKKPLFSDRINDALAITAIVDEMARADHWQGMDECLVFKPKMIKTYTHYAEAALRAIKRIEQQDAENLPPVH